MSPIRAFLIVAALLVVFVASGWRTAADAKRDEEVRQHLKGVDRDTFDLERRVNELDQRVKALEDRP